MVTGQEVWEALQADPDMVQKGDRLPDEVLRRLAVASPDLFADELSQPASVESLTKCRLRLNRHLLGGTFLHDALAAIPAGEVPWSERPELLAEIRAEIEEENDILLMPLSDVGAFFEQIGETDEEAMLSEEMGLNEAMRAAYQAGTLTVVQLLREQPGVILL